MIISEWEIETWLSGKEMVIIILQQIIFKNGNVNMDHS